VQQPELFPLPTYEPSGTHRQMPLLSAKPVQQLPLPPTSRVPSPMHPHIPLLSLPLQQLEP
jgi:hypothetical protein